MCHAVDPLADRVLARFVVHPNHACVSGGITCVDFCAHFRVGIHEALQCGRVRAINHLSSNLAGLPVLDSRYRRFANRPASSLEFLVLVLVLLLATHIRFVRLDRPL